jgi:hypothetical protein
VYSFHEASHRKYTIPDAIGMLQEFGLYEDYVRMTQNLEFPLETLNELPVTIDELGLIQRRPDLRLHIEAILAGALGIKHILAHILAKRYLLEKESARIR